MLQLKNLMAGNPGEREESRELFFDDYAKNKNNLHDRAENFIFSRFAKARRKWNEYSPSQHVPWYP